MTPPRLRPGDTAWIRSLQGRVIGPLKVEVVEIVINRSGRFDRYRFEFDAKIGHPSQFPIDGEKVFGSMEEAEGTGR